MNSNIRIGICQYEYECEYLSHSDYCGLFSCYIINMSGSVSHILFLGYHCIAVRALFRYRDISVMAVFMYCLVLSCESWLDIE